MRDKAYLDAKIAELFPEYHKILQVPHNNRIVGDSTKFSKAIREYLERNPREEGIYRGKVYEPSHEKTPGDEGLVKSLVYEIYNNLSYKNFNSPASKRLNRLVQKSLENRGIKTSSNTELNLMLYLNALLGEKVPEETVKSVLRTANLAVSAVTEKKILNYEIDTGILEDLDSVVRAGRFYSNEDLSHRSVERNSAEVRLTALLASLVPYLSEEDLASIDKILEKAEKDLEEGIEPRVNRHLRPEIAYLTSKHFTEAYPDKFISIVACGYEDFEFSIFTPEEDVRNYRSIVAREQELFEYLLEKVLKESPEGKTREEKLSIFGQLQVSEKFIESLDKVRDFKVSKFSHSKNREYAILRHLLETGSEALAYDTAQVDIARTLLADSIK